MSIHLLLRLINKKFSLYLFLLLIYHNKNELIYDRIFLGSDLVKKWITNIIIIILTIVCIFCLYKIVLWYMDNKNNKELNNELNNIANITESDNGKKVNQPKNKFDPYWAYINYSLIDVDFERLLKTNSTRLA